MTALPATRQEALNLVRHFTVTGPPGMWHGDDWSEMLALARRGADTVGATEAWLYDEDGTQGYVYLHEKRIPPPCLMRRCLVLPEPE